MSIGVHRVRNGHRARSSGPSTDGRSSDCMNSARNNFVTSKAWALDFHRVANNDANVILRATTLMCLLAVGAAHGQRQTAARPSAVIGTVTDSAGTPLIDAEVRLVVSAVEAAVVRTQDDGRFVVMGELNGPTTLQVRHLGF